MFEYFCNWEDKPIVVSRARFVVLTAGCILAAYFIGFAVGQKRGEHAASKKFGDAIMTGQDMVSQKSTSADVKALQEKLATAKSNCSQAWLEVLNVQKHAYELQTKLSEATYENLRLGGELKRFKQPKPQPEQGSLHAIADTVSRAAFGFSLDE